MKKERLNTWGIRPKRPLVYQPCLHLHNGRIDIAKTCVRNYECGHCFFDQWLEETEESLVGRESIRAGMDDLSNAL